MSKIQDDIERPHCEFSTRVRGDRMGVLSIQQTNL